MPQSGYQVLSSDREEEVHFQFTPNVARSKCLWKEYIQCYCAHFFLDLKN